MADTRFSRFAMLACMALVFKTAPAPADFLKEPPVFERFKFKIDPKTPLEDLLPVRPVTAPYGDVLSIKDLSSIPEVQFQARPNVKSYRMENLSSEQKADLARVIRRGMIDTAHQIAKINHVNQQERDRFLKLLIEHRPDLAGLPFMMGDACRLKGDERKFFKSEVATVRRTLASEKVGSKQFANTFWKTYDDGTRERKGTSATKAVEERCAIAALMQILGPEDRLHSGLVKYLPSCEKSEEFNQQTTRALARLAVFSMNEIARQAAQDALEKRAPEPARDVLLHGLRYPWPSIATNAADAIVRLKRTDLVPELIKMLDEPDPRAPVLRTVKGKKVQEVREVVRINHHRNCLLCHPPGNSADVNMKLREFGKSETKDDGVQSVWVDIEKFDEEVEIGAVPILGEPLPSGFSGYRSFSSPDILVRADVTYLRQDFSMMQNVDNAFPWPEMQRFDFLVRKRLLTEKESQATLDALAKQDSVYRQIALDALRRLTGRDVGITAEAWRKAVMDSN